MLEIDLDENELDSRADVSCEIKEELDEDYKLNTLSNFKNFITKYPEFYGVDNISSFEMLNFILEDNIVKNNVVVDKEILDCFDDLYLELFGEISDFSKYKTVIYKIFNKIYV